MTKDTENVSTMQSNLRAMGQRLRSRPELTAGTAILLLMGVVSLIGPLLWTTNATAVDLSRIFQAPSWTSPFGTDQNGRDVFARSLSAARLDLMLGIGVTVVGAAIGIVIGVFAAVNGDIIDMALMRVMDALLAFPPLVLAIGISVALGSGTVAASIGITVATIPYYARLMRGEVLRVQSLPFVEAARVSGAKRWKIVHGHLLPHTWRIMGVQASATVGYSVLTLAGLGFVGLGVQPPTAEWGVMISDGLQYVVTGQWWIGVFPGLLLLLFVTGCNLVADGFGAPRRLRWGGIRDTIGGSRS